MFVELKFVFKDFIHVKIYNFDELALKLHNVFEKELCFIFAIFGETDREQTNHICTL